MRVTTEATEEVVHLFVDHRVIGHELFKRLKLFGGGEFTVKQQIADFEKVRLAGKLIDWIAAVQQDAFFTIDISDGAVTGRS